MSLRRTQEVPVDDFRTKFREARDGALTPRQSCSFKSSSNAGLARLWFDSPLEYQTQEDWEMMLLCAARLPVCRAVFIARFSCDENIALTMVDRYSINYLKPLHKRVLGVQCAVIDAGCAHFFMTLYAKREVPELYEGGITFEELAQRLREHGLDLDLLPEMSQKAN